MRLSERATVVLRVAAAFILAACATSTAWAQQAYDTGSQYEFGRELDAVPIRSGDFDYGLSPKFDERSPTGTLDITHLPSGLFVSGAYESDAADAGEDQPYGWLRGNDEYAEGGRDRIQYGRADSLDDFRYARGLEIDDSSHQDAASHLPLEYSYSEGIQLPLRYDWSSLEDEPAPTQDDDSSTFGLGLGWDIQPSGGLFGAWSDEPEEEEFTMEPFAGKGGFLAPSLADLPEDDSSVFIDPPTIQFDDDPADQDGSDSGFEFAVEYSFGDPFQLRLPYKNHAEPESVIPELEGALLPHRDDSSTSGSVADDPQGSNMKFTIRPFIGKGASVFIDPPTLDLDSAGPDVESVIPELTQPQQGLFLPGNNDSSTSGSTSSDRSQSSGPGYQPLPPARPAWKVESDHRVAVTRRYIEDNLRGEFYDALHAHADGSGSLEQVEEAYNDLKNRH
ncbi:MAG: hypothetical protein E2O61_02455 [Gammaproteobacteria bacterium]|nr:MAG: hypothetical protein E2O61_02455 [Gammaproteobacteria bacterium]